MANQPDGHVRAIEQAPASCRRAPRSSHLECRGPREPAPARVRGGGESSRVRDLRWALLLDGVTSSGEGLAGCSSEVQAEARELAREEGALALESFEGLFADHHGAIIDAASASFFRDAMAEAPRVQHPGAYFRSWVRWQAVAWTERCLESESRAAGLSAQEREILVTLHDARRRARRLRGLSFCIFFSICALDGIALERDSAKVVLSAAVAFGMRRSTAYQHMSRVRRKLFSEVGSAAWKHAWRYLVAPPPAVSLSARAYLDACQSNEAGLERWASAHKAHNSCFNAQKLRSRGAALAWRDFTAALDACPTRPGAVQASLVAASKGLGIDAQVVPARLGASSWRDILHLVKRPIGTVRAAWRAFLSRHAFGDAALGAWQRFEARAVAAEDATRAVNEAFDVLLEAAAARPSNFVNARAEFRSLVDQHIGVGRG